SLFLLLCLSVVACKSSTDNGTPAKAGLTPPGVGSVFIYRLLEVDSNGTTVSALTYDTITVLANGIYQFGRSDVMQLKATPLFTHYFSAFWDYDGFGDAVYYENVTGRPGDVQGWVTVPISSKGTHSYLQEDTTWPIGSF